MGNGNAEENAQDRQAAFKSALTGNICPYSPWIINGIGC